MKTTQTHAPLFDSFLFLIDVLILQFINQHPDYQIDKSELKKIGSDALKQACETFDPLTHYPFEEFASQIILQAFKKEYTAWQSANGLLSMEGIIIKGKIDISAINQQTRPSPRSTEHISNIYRHRNSLSRAQTIAEINQPSYYDSNTDEYKTKNKHGLQLVKKEPLSTFSISVDTASYGLVRKQIMDGHLPNPESVRTEELINYFDYNYPNPQPNEQLGVSYEIGTCPWQPKHQLVKIALKAKEIEKENLPASHLVFLIDVSGSMEGRDRLELVKSSLKMLTDQLRNTDKISILVFSNDVEVLLDNESGSNKDTIKNIINGLYASGGTYGANAIQKAYEIAKKNFIKEGNNRVVLCTDGDFNIGVSSEEGLEKLVAEKAKSNIFLTIFGYGMGNYKDSKVKTLALKGHGNYAYIDTLLEANQAVVKEYSNAMFAAAKDVKIQVEFNPTKVNAYRLIGYETNILEAEDFNDDQKDAGVVGVGHKVTALYELVPDSAPLVDPLKYQQKKNEETTNTPFPEELMTIKIRYKMPDKNISKKIELPVIANPNSKSSPDFNFAAAVAMFGEILSNSEYRGNASYDKIIALAKPTVHLDESGYRHEFVRLVEAVGNLECKI